MEMTFCCNCLWCEVMIRERESAREIEGGEREREREREGEGGGGEITRHPPVTIKQQQFVSTWRQHFLFGEFSLLRHASCGFLFHSYNVV